VTTPLSDNTSTGWTKIKSDARGKAGRLGRTQPAIQRHPSGNKQARLILPCGMMEKGRANIYSDGNGKLAFSASIDGEYAVRQNSKGSKSLQISIPQCISAGIPFGTHNVDLGRDGDMLVLDLAAAIAKAEAGQ
jgi:hypothetical protein